MCFLFHNYKVVSTEKGHGENLLGSRIRATLLKKVCRDCQKTKEEWKKGEWILEDFK